MKGIYAQIFSDNGKTGSIFFPCSRGNFDLKEGESFAEVRVKKVYGKDYINARPSSIEKNKNVMFGGAFIYSHDSRFAEISPYPIPLHDRVE